MGPVSDGPRRLGSVRPGPPCCATSWRAAMTRASRWLGRGLLPAEVAGPRGAHRRHGRRRRHRLLRGALACTHLFLGVLAGYHVPTPVGEGGQPASASFTRPWALPLVVGLGPCSAPSSSSASPPTPRDTAPTRPSRPSTTTPGASVSGPSSSRSSPRPSPSVRAVRVVGRDRPARSVLASPPSWPGSSTSAPPMPASRWSTGIGSGIGAIFGAPLGGAVLATEILYRDDFDVEALLPSFVASTRRLRHLRRRRRLHAVCSASTAATTSPIPRSSSGSP